MSVLDSYRLLIGSRGWQHENWQDSFYPDDLPEEWQLGYYGNEFPVVMITEQEWQQTDNVAAWLEETDELPVFIAELPLQSVTTDLLAAAAPYLENIRLLQQRCVGIVCRLPRTDIDIAKPLLEACRQHCATCVDVSAMQLTESEKTGFCQWLKQANINLVESSCKNDNCVDGDLRVIELNSDEVDLKSMRQVIECLLNDEQTSRKVLLLGGKAVTPDLLKQAYMVLDLL